MRPLALASLALLVLGASNALAGPDHSHDHHGHDHDHHGHAHAHQGHAHDHGDRRPDGEAAPHDSPRAGEDWCPEHAVPESMCTRCNPKLVSRFIQAGDYCRTHGFPESVCPRCNPDRVTATGHDLPPFPPAGTVIRLASPEIERAAGLSTVHAQERSLSPEVTATGRLEFDVQRLARLTARGEATVLAVKADVGDEVRRGQAVVVLTSGAVGAAQSRLAAAEARLKAARAALQREKELAGISARSDLEQAASEVAAAQAERDAARAELRAAGARGADAGGRYVLVAPFDGTVTARFAVAGLAVAAGEPLLEIADPRSLQAVLDIPEERASEVRLGQRVILHVENENGPRREARVDRLAAQIDPKTRTVRARVTLPNPDQVLRAGALVRALIQTTAPRRAVVVPRDAVQHAEGHDLVFVRKGPALFEPVSVRLGHRHGREVEILEGLAPGAEVVTTGAFALKTELMKDAIGAGCAHD